MAGVGPGAYTKVGRYDTK